MNFIKEYKSVICILLVAVFVFALTTVATSATIDNLDSVKDLTANNTKTDDKNNTLNIRVENSATENESDTNTNANKNNTNTNSNINTEKNANLTVNNNVNTSYPNKDYSTTSENQIANTGIEDYPSAILLVALAIAAIVGYVKIKKYNAM